MMNVIYHKPRRVGLVVSLSASHAIDRSHVLVPAESITKDRHKMVQTASLRRHTCVRINGLTVQPDCLKGHVVCGTVYGDMRLKDLLA